MKWLAIMGLALLDPEGAGVKAAGPGVRNGGQDVKLPQKPTTRYLLKTESNAGLSMPPLEAAVPAHTETPPSSWDDSGVRMTGSGPSTALFAPG